MIVQKYAWEYDGGTKQKKFEELREILRSFETLVEEISKQQFTKWSRILHYHL